MNFTFNGNQSAEQRIRLHQSIIASEVLKAIPEKNLTAIVMVGGYGRSEGAFVKHDKGYGPYNDYDYFLVFTGVTKKRAQQLILNIPDLDSTVGVEVDFFPILENKIDKLEFSLMNAEMQLGHRVIWGDEAVLDRMQQMPLAQLDLTEFERLLTNRGCLLLMNHLDNGHEHMSKYINKAWLAIGDALLALAGKYELSYVNKKLAIEQATSDPLVIDAYLRAIDIRFRPDLFLPWGLEDLDIVTDYWSATLGQVESSKQRLDSASHWTNIFRNLRDRRLLKLDHPLTAHPRVQVTNRLKSLITPSNDRQWQKESNKLLSLWGSYS